MMQMIFKQLLQLEAIDVCQIDSCRLAGVNEILSVLMMSAKFGIPVCPHAGKSSSRDKSEIEADNKVVSVSANTLSTCP
jgi:hypothetical protein